MEVYPLTDQGYGADEQLAQLFTPRTILPSQFFRGLAWCAGLQGEQRLMLAVLEDAIHVYCKESATPGRRNSWLFREAEEWIESGDHSRVFSFACICEVLGLDAEYIRRRLHARRKRSRLVRGAHPTTHAASCAERAGSRAIPGRGDERLDTDGVRNGTGDRR